MEINKTDGYIEIIRDGKTFFYGIPTYKGYDYLNLVLKLNKYDIYMSRIGVKSCNIVSNKKILTKLKKEFGNNRVKFTGSYSQKIYQYNIILLNNKEYEEFKKVNSSDE